jgi:hypothetical protein
MLEHPATGKRLIADNNGIAGKWYLFSTGIRFCISSSISVLAFLMILFHICQQVCRHSVIFACSLDVREPVNATRQEIGATDLQTECSHIHS